MSISEFKSVGQEGISSLLAARPARLEAQVPSEVPSNSSGEADADAVLLQLSESVENQTAQSYPESASEKAEDFQGVDPETAERIAENLRQALASIKSTKVTFDPSIQKEGRSSLSFQVVDTTSGEVVRQFPSEIADSLAHRTELAQTAGLLLEESV